MADLKWCKLHWFYIVICFSTKFLASVSVEFNDRPVIGVVTSKITDVTLMKLYPELKGRSYLSAGYVKMIEMTGAQAVPVFCEQGEEEWRKIFESVNGFVFPGGEASLENSGYCNLTKIILEWAMEANDEGDFFPLLGICRGMQAFMTIAFGDITPLSLTDSKNYSTTLKWDKNALSASIFSDIPEKLIEHSERNDITAHFHKYSILFSTQRKLKALRDNFKVVATSVDRQGKEFLSIIEGVKYPFYGLQFHPEKVLFEWLPTLKIPRSKEAIQLSQHFLDIFTEQAKRNRKHRFKDYNETQHYSIYKHTPIYMGTLKDSNTPFMQIYVF